MATRNENEVNADVIEGTNQAFMGAWLWSLNLLRSRLGISSRLLRDISVRGDMLLRFTPLLSGNWLEI